MINSDSANRPSWMVLWRPRSHIRIVHAWSTAGIIHDRSLSQIGASSGDRLGFFGDHQPRRSHGSFSYLYLLTFFSNVYSAEIGNQTSKSRLGKASCFLSSQVGDLPAESLMSCERMSRAWRRDPPQPDPSRQRPRPKQIRQRRPSEDQSMPTSYTNRAP